MSESASSPERKEDVEDGGDQHEEIEPENATSSGQSSEDVIEAYEEKFKGRFTETDPVYKAYCSLPPSTPPVVHPWNPNGPRRDDYRSPNQRPNDRRSWNPRPDDRRQWNPRPDDRRQGNSSRDDDRQRLLRNDDDPQREASGSSKRIRSPEDDGDHN